MSERLISDFNNSLLIARFFMEEVSQQTDFTGDPIMIFNERMVDTLHAIRRIEGKEISKILDVPAAELGNCLIRVYSKTHNLVTRELITDFMEQAGVVWTRKLLTRDTTPIVSTLSSVDQHFATLADYVGLLAANDDGMLQGVAS